MFCGFIPSARVTAAFLCVCSFGRLGRVAPALDRQRNILFDVFAQSLCSALQKSFFDCACGHRQCIRIHMYTLLATFRYSSEHLKQLFRVFFGVIRALRDKRESIACVRCSGCREFFVSQFLFPRNSPSFPNANAGPTSRSS